MQLITTNKPSKTHNSFHLLGKQYFERQNYGLSKKLLSKAIRLNPELTDSHFYLGLCCYFCGEKDEAIKHLEHFTVQSNHNEQLAQALDTIGKCYQELGNSDKALTYYESALKTYNECSSAWHNMGILHMESAMKLVDTDLSASIQAFTRAKENLSKALEFVADNPVFIHSVASWYEAFISALKRQNQDNSTGINECFKAAIFYYEKSLSLSNSKPLSQIIITNLTECLAQFGHFYYRQGNYELALVEYQATLNTVPNHLIALNQAGMCYFKQGDFRQAIHYFTESLNYSTTNEDKADSLLNIACAYRKLGNFEKAMPFLNQAKSLSPEDEYIIEEEKSLREAISKKTVVANSFFNTQELPDIRLPNVTPTDEGDTKECSFGEVNNPSPTPAP